MKKTFLVISIITISAAIGNNALATNIATVGGTAGGTAFTEQPAVPTASIFNPADYDDATYPTMDLKIAQWINDNAGTFADVGTTFGVFTNKLNDVNTDIANTYIAKTSIQDDFTSASAGEVADALAVKNALDLKADVSSLGTIASKNYTSATYTPGSSLSTLRTYINDHSTEIADLGTTAALVEDFFNDKQGWISEELGYDTVSTDAGTLLVAAGFTNQTDLDSDVGLIDAALQLKNEVAVTTDGNYILSSKTAAENLSLLDTQVKSNTNAIGDISEFDSNNHYAKATTNIADNLTQLDTALKNSNDIIGSAINADGTKNTDAITVKNQDGTAVTTLTDAVNLIGDLSSTGIGATTLAGQIGFIGSTIANRTTGTISGTNTVAANLLALDTAIGANVTNAAKNLVVTNSVNANLDALDAAIGDRTTLGTNNMATNSTIVAALNALDTEIGADSDYTSTFNGVAGTNSIKANINAVNATIGDITTLATYTTGGHTGNAVTNGGANTPTTVVAALNNIDATLGQIHGLRANSNLGTSGSNLASGTTVEQHLVSLDDAIGDRTALTSSNTAINNAVATDMATAFNTTGNLIGDMDLSSTKFLAGATDLSDAVRTLDKNIERVENKLEETEYELKSGLAAVSALSALVPNARDSGNTQISVGTGVYSDRIGIAVGGFHYFNDHVLFNAGASYGGTKDWAFRAGVTFGL